MIFRNARQDELNSIYELYQSVIGSEFCVWNSLYPGMSEVRHDYETSNLFVIEHNGRIIASSSIVPENEMDDFDCWSYCGGKAAEIARVVVAEQSQGRKIAALMVSSIIDILVNRGYGAVHLSCADVNIPALKTYRKLGFVTAGETDMYGNHYYLLEKNI